MLPKLAAEEELLARATTSHPHMDGKDQSRHIARLTKIAGIAEPARKPTRADLVGLGIRDVTGVDQ